MGRPVSHPGSDAPSWHLSDGVQLSRVEVQLYLLARKLN